MPINNRSGNASEASMPTLKSHSIMPVPPVASAPITFESGILTSIAPKPIGRRSAGSISFFMARKISNAPIIHITTCCHVTSLIASARNCIKPPLLSCVIYFISVPRHSVSPRAWEMGICPYRQGVPCSRANFRKRSLFRLSTKEQPIVKRNFRFAVAPRDKKETTPKKPAWSRRFRLNRSAPCARVSDLIARGNNAA